MQEIHASRKALQGTDKDCLQLVKRHIQCAMSMHVDHNCDDYLYYHDENDFYPDHDVSDDHNDRRSGSRAPQRCGRLTTRR